MARLGIGYLTSNRYAAHPFSPETQALAYDPAHAAVGSDGILPADFILDAVLSLGEPYAGVELARIDWDAGAKEFILTFFAEPGNYVCWATVPDIPVIESAMVRGGYYMLTYNIAYAPQISLRAVCDRGFVRYLEQIKAGGFADFRNKGGLHFAAEAIDRSPPKVLSLSLWHGDMTAVDPGLALNGDVLLLPGYNVGALAVPDINDSFRLTLYATPGAGEGAAPCSEHPPESHVPMAMDLKPDNDGAVRLEGDECFAVIPNPLTKQIAIHGSCTACCTCDDYVAVARYLAELIQRTHELRLLLQQLHEEYDAHRLDYENRHFPVLRKGYLTVQAFRGLKAIDSKLGGAMGHGHATVTLTNKGDGPMTSVRLVMSASGADLAGGVYKVGTNGGASMAGMTITATIPEGEALVAVLRFRKPGGGTIVGTFSASVSYTINGRTYTESASTSFGAPN